MTVYRNCKFCHERISIRKMPAGQWVAFDFGSDNPHECRRINRNGDKALQSVDGSNRVLLIELLRTAINQHQCVELVYYTSGRDSVTNRTVEPLEFQYGDKVLIAYCRWRKENRAFAIKNIRKATLLEEQYRQDTKQSFVSPLPSQDTQSSMAKPPQVSTNPRSSGYGWLGWAAIITIVFYWIYSSQ